MGDIPLSTHESFNKPITYAAEDETHESFTHITEPNNPPASKGKKLNAVLFTSWV